jgi:hypothetical protein
LKVFSVLRSRERERERGGRGREEEGGSERDRDVKYNRRRVHNREVYGRMRDTLFQGWLGERQGVGGEA